MLKTFSITDIGKKRKLNQDYVFSSDTRIGNLSNVFIVADGMGGHNAGEVASAVGAEKLIILTDVPGVLRDPSDPDSLIQKIRISEVPKLIEDGIISGGMIPKVECCIDAIRKGVEKVIIMDGRIPHSILIELLTDEGAGTMVTEEYDDER